MREHQVVELGQQAHGRARVPGGRGASRRSNSSRSRSSRNASSFGRSRSNTGPGRRRRASPRRRPRSRPERAQISAYESGDVATLAQRALEPALGVSERSPGRVGPATAIGDAHQRETGADHGGQRTNVGVRAPLRQGVPQLGGGERLLSANTAVASAMRSSRSTPRCAARGSESSTPRTRVRWRSRSAGSPPRAPGGASRASSGPAPPRARRSRDEGRRRRSPRGATTGRGRAGPAPEPACRPAVPRTRSR